MWLVDDSATERAIIAASIADTYDVQQFATAAEMLELLASKQPDLLLLDWHMPEVSGREACSFVREHIDRAHLPILVLTAAGHRDDLLAAFAAGANDYVSKPFDAEELRARVATLVQSKWLRDDLAVAEERLTAEGELRERFIAILAHDLRQPLNVITMSVPTLGHDASPEVRRRIAASVGRAAERMKRMISDLLDFARARPTSTMPINVADADAVAVVRGVIEEVRLAHPGRLVDFRSSEEERGVWDADRLAQVTSNLVANALHHGLPEASIDVAVQSHADGVVITVTNEGALGATELRELFQPFAAQSSGAGTRQGLGLGLYIVKQTVLAHGGTVEATSDAGRVRFTVRLPRRPPG